MKIVIPMAGRGSRFAGSDHHLPKPLIPVAGKPMLHWAMQSLADIPRSQTMVVALEDHQAKHDVSRLIHECAGADVEIMLLPKVTQGQLCTVLAARGWLDSDEDLLIASADTYVNSHLALEVSAKSSETRGIISVADMPGERWSFARTDNMGRVLEVAEKVRISDHASTGLYYFASGRELLTVADEMIAKQEMTNGEYYVIPVYQKYIQRGWRVQIAIASEMHDMGTPEALAAFEVYLQEKG
jgi:dTDP-glucose pyrophosphorylase